MNKFNLSFTDQTVENKYRVVQHKNEFNILEVNFKYFCILLIIPMVDNFIMKKYLYSAITAIIFISVAYVKFRGKNSPSLLNISCFIVQIILNLYLPISFYLDGATNENQSAYYLGQSTCYASFSFLIGTSFILKALVCLLNCLNQVFLLWIKDSDFYSVGRYFFLAYTLTLINTLYQLEKEKRQKFQLQGQKSQFDELIFQQSYVSVISCYFNHQKNNIFLEKTNELAKKKFGINSHTQYKLFIRKMIILQYGIQKNQQQQQQKSKKNISLEEFLYELFQSSERKNSVFKLEQTIYELQFFVIGKFQKQQYKINISFFDSENPQCMIIVENDIDHQEKLREYQLKLEQWVNVNFIQKLEVLISNCTISLNNLLKSQISVRSIKQNIEQVQLWIYLIINSISNKKLFLQGLNQDLECSSFSLKNLIKEILKIFQPLLKLKQIHCILQIQKDDFEMITIKPLLFQIIFNLLLNSIQFGNRQSLILVQISQRKNMYLNKNIIIITIQDSNIQINHSILNKLPILFPQSQESFEHIFSNKKVLLIYIIIYIVAFRNINFLSHIKKNRCFSKSDNRTNKRTSNNKIRDFSGIIKFYYYQQQIIDKAFEIYQTIKELIVLILLKYQLNFILLYTDILFHILLIFIQYGEYVSEKKAQASSIKIKLTKTDQSGQDIFYEENVLPSQNLSSNGIIQQNQYQNQVNVSVSEPKEEYYNQEINNSAEGLLDQEKENQQKRLVQNVENTYPSQQDVVIIYNENEIKEELSKAQINNRLSDSNVPLDSLVNIDQQKEVDYQKEPEEHKSSEKKEDEVAKALNSIQVTNQTVMFEWNQGGNKCQLTGDWLNWSERIELPKIEDGKFETQISLAKGEYLFKFIVDDNWLTSESYMKKEDGCGGENNYLLIN